MPEERDPLDGPEKEHGDPVPAVFARDAEEAEKYCELLNDHDIPAVIGVDVPSDDEDDEPGVIKDDRGMTRGVPVLVPDAMLEEASEVIADRENLSEFSIDDEDEEDDEDDELESDDEELDDELDDDDEDDEDDEDDKFDAEDDEDDEFLGGDEDEDDEDDDQEF